MLKKLTLFFILCLFGMNLTGYSDNKPIEVIGINNDYPYMYTDQDGVPSGFIVDFLDHFSEDLQKEIHISLYEPSEALSVLKSVEIFYTTVILN